MLDDLSVNSHTPSLIFHKFWILSGFIFCLIGLFYLHSAHQIFQNFQSQHRYRMRLLLRRRSLPVLELFSLSLWLWKCMIFFSFSRDNRNTQYSFLDSSTMAEDWPDIISKCRCTWMAQRCSSKWIRWMVVESWRIWAYKRCVCWSKGQCRSIHRISRIEYLETHSRRKLFLR